MEAHDAIDKVSKELGKWIRNLNLFIFRLLFSLALFTFAQWRFSILSSLLVCCIACHFCSVFTAFSPLAFSKLIWKCDLESLHQVDFLFLWITHKMPAIITTISYMILNWYFRLCHCLGGKVALLSENQRSWSLQNHDVQSQSAFGKLRKKKITVPNVNVLTFITIDRLYF